MSFIPKEFGISSWAVDNRVTVYIITFAIVLLGTLAYVTMPREDFPEIIENKIFISSIYPGNAAEDVEKLVTDPLEKKIKNLSGVTKVTSSSFQDFSLIVAEFDDKHTLEQAKQKTKDEVDIVKSGNDWPKMDNGGKVEPTIFNINIAEEVAILNINLKGDYPAQTLKDYAKIIKDDVENISEIKKVEILGVGEKEVEIALDLFKMAGAAVSFDDVQRAVQGENMTISGGNIENSGKKSNIRVIGEFDSPNELNNIVVKSFGGSVMLRDIANVQFKEKERSTFARESGEEVVMINVKKRSGTNMIHAIEKVKVKVAELKKEEIPGDISIEYTGDQSSRVEHAVDELSNHIIFGIVLVMLVLMFTMGLRNSLFVGSAIPLSMLMAFAFLDAFGVTLNTMVLFALVMGLGMLVDDGIVVVDNVFANMQKGMDRITASKIGIGEIAWPVISSTATTLAAFFPLGLWPGTMGKFMIYFPATLSVVLGASLIVAMIINASMTGGFMKLKDENISFKSLKKYSKFLLLIGLLFSIPGWIKDSGILRAIGHLSFLLIGFLWLYHKYIYNATQSFQHDKFPRFENWYARKLTWIFEDKRYKSAILTVIFGLLILPIAWMIKRKDASFSKPQIALYSIVWLLLLSLMVFGVFPRDIWFFPDNIPNQNIVYIEYPQGTPIEKTNEATKQVEKQVLSILNKYKKGHESEPKFLVQSVVTQVGEGAGNPKVDMGNSSETPFKGKVTVLFQEFKDRKGVNSQEILNDLRANIKSIPGAKVTIEKDNNGPPVGYPISIELQGEDYDQMLAESKKVIDFINSKRIPGIEQLSVDINKDKPELKMSIDRTLAGNLMASTGMVGFNLRRALYGQEISTYKEGDDNYKIIMRLNDIQRKDESLILNQPITFRNQMNGQMIQIPMATLARSEQTYTFNQINHKGGNRIMTVYSNLLDGYNANEIMSEIKNELKVYKLPAKMNFGFSGEQEEQDKNQNFLNRALLLALFGVTLIIVLQFNSTSKTFIIMATVLLSFSGVFFGLTLAQMDFVILMTMMGIISLVGVVVKNGIVLMDFFILLLDKKKAELNLATHEDIPMDQFVTCIVEAGRSRLRPVLLTATTAVLGLIPLAIGLNFNFFTFLTDLNPHIYLGGDNVIFWGPLAWTIIFGLTYATILTLVMVPVMFYLVSKWKHNIRMHKIAQADYEV
jgi:multidrug efflux pump subunit AcrB